MRLSRNCVLVFRIGFGLLAAAVLSYLAAIWTSETTSERFGLSGLVFMLSGLVAFLFGYAMSPSPSSRK